MYNCCDLSSNSPQLIPFIWMAEDEYLGQELSVNWKEFKSCLWDGLKKKISMKNLYTFKSTEVFRNRNRYVYIPLFNARVFEDHIKLVK